MATARVAVVIEDDQDIRELLSVVLQQSGFEVYMASTGLDGVAAVELHRPTIVTLDLGLPDIDGFEVARRIRLFSDAYVIVLTGSDDEMDTLEGLNSGADDYLTKPFRPRELRARIAAMLRRPRASESAAPGTGQEVSAPPTPAAPSATSAVGLDGLSIDGDDRTAAVDGVPLELTRTEFDLLHALVLSGRVVRTKADLVRRLRGESYDGGSYISDADERTIEVHITNLRRKLGDNPRQPRWIKTVRGVGYQMAR